MFRSKEEALTALRTKLVRDYFPTDQKGEPYNVHKVYDKSAIKNLQDKLDAELRLGLKVVEAWKCDKNGKVFYEIEGVPKKRFETRDLVKILGIGKERPKTRVHIREGRPSKKEQIAEDSNTTDVSQESFNNRKPLATIIDDAMNDLRSMFPSVDEKTLCTCAKMLIKAELDL